MSPELYGVMNSEIEGQLDKLSDEQQKVEEEIANMLANCEKKLCQHRVEK